MGLWFLLTLATAGGILNNMKEIAEAILVALDEGYSVPATYVGKGCSRIVYRVANKVYKFNRSDIHDSNLEEYENWQRLSSMDLHPDICLPAFELITLKFKKNKVNVIVSDFIDGAQVENNEESDSLLVDFSNQTGMNDCWENNVIVKDNKYWLVDLEC